MSTNQPFVFPPPPQGASIAYTALHVSALTFISAQAQNDNYPSRMAFDLHKDLIAPDFQHSWGHNYGVSKDPRLQGALSFDQFKAHLASMVPHLESWHPTVTDVVVDEMKRKVVLRISFGMVVKGEDVGVENDLVWVVEMDGEGKVRRSVEFVDGVAAGRLKEIIMGRARA
jgi:ketosteroid isomerase-like protein